MTDLIGTQYRARVRLSTRDNVTLAEAGQTCEHVPVESLEPLLASGKIVPVVEAVTLEPVEVVALEDVLQDLLPAAAPDRTVA